MTLTTSIQATHIAQPKAGKQITNAKGQNIKSPSVCRDGNANPAYHPWEYKSLQNFIEGKQIQCGRKSTYACNLKTVRWIKGYRNTCPIAGCCGTFNRPAPLELDKFNFKTKKITKPIKISEIKVQYQHKCTGVNVSVGSGSETTSWAGQFSNVTLTLYHNNTKIQSITHKKSVPLGKNGTVLVTFTKKISSFNPAKDNLRIEINYPANGGGQYSTQATNPSIIYATGLKVNMKYDYINTPKISEIAISANKNSIITDPRNPKNNSGDQNCRDTIIHTLKYLNTTPNDVVVTVPNGVIFTKTINTIKQQITYTYQDISGIAGTKRIIYTLKSNKKQQNTQQFTSKLYDKPTVIINTNYIKNQKYQTNDTFIKVDGNCWNKIEIYIDGKEKILATLNKTTLNAQNAQESFLANINELSCGKHSLYVYIDNLFYKEINIQVNPPIIAFNADLLQKYTQSETPVQVNIERTDNNQLNNPIEVTIIDTATSIKTTSFLPQDIYSYELDISTPGKYELKCKYNDGCKDTEYILGSYVIKPSHRQSYDYLLIRGENSNIEYDSIVIREGDFNTTPVTYTHAVLKNSMNDFVLFGKNGLCNIGDLGYGILAVKNISNSTIKNLAIELNPFSQSEDEYEEFDENMMEWKTGILQHFDDNFAILNQNINNIVEIFNTQNRDLINEGTENVVLRFTEIKPNDVIEVKIPYMSSYVKQINMNFLVLGEEYDVISLDAYNPYTDAYTSYSKSKAVSSIILAVQDAFSAELSIEGDDLDRNDLNNTDNLDITYKVQISSEECDESTIKNAEIPTKIINDARLIPVGYKKGSTIKMFDLSDNLDFTNPIEYTSRKDGISVFRGVRTSGYKPMRGENIYLRYLDINNNIKHLRSVTDNNGIARFNFVIPTYFQSNDDKNSSLNNNNKKQYYLSDILQNIDIFYLGDDFHEGANLNTTINHALPQTQIQIIGFYYIKSNQKVFVRAAQIKDQDINNISSEVHLIGKLVDQSNVGINDKIITYENKNLGVYQQVITGNVIHIDELSTDDYSGYFDIHIHSADDTYNFKTIYDSSYISFAGDLFYDKIGFGMNNNKIDTQDKIEPELICVHDYGAYRRGETIPIDIKLQKQEQEFENYIEISQSLTNTCQSTIHIFYKTCSEKNTEGWKTIYQTNGGKLLPNQTEEYIYCNVDTDLKILARLEKHLIENHNVNVLTINAINGYKPNKDVIIKGIISPNITKKRLGDYLALTAVDIDKEKYSYDKNSDIVYWKIDTMNSYERQKCNILLEAEHIGHNMIYIGGFDYLNKDDEMNIQTTLTLECDNNSEYYMHESIPIKAKLHAANTSHDIFGSVIFKAYEPDEDITDESAGKTFAISEVSNINGEYCAQAYFRPDKNNMRIKAFYEESKIFSITYTASESDTIEFNNVTKYDTTLKLSSDQTTYNTEEVIQIKAAILYQDTDNTKEKYFDKDIDIKFLVEDREISNITYVDREYMISFAITQPGQYVIRAFIPNTEVFNESSDTLTINVEAGE